MIWDEQPDEKMQEEEASETKKQARRRQTECYELSTKYEYRRAYSESKMLDACGAFDFKQGYTYNFITAGDVDSLTYLKAVLRQQDLEYCLFSTWCMSAEDVLQFEQWVEAGKIGRLDAYVGEIFPTSYRIEYKMLKKFIDSHNWRLCVFRNHSKIYAGWGKKFAFAIQTSANINTNPRTENGCITIDKGLAMFYKEYFDGIQSFDK